MKATYEKNQEYIDKIQNKILRLKKASDSINETIGELQEELQAIQSENAIMAEEMKAGKSID